MIDWLTTEQTLAVSISPLWLLIFVALFPVVKDVSEWVAKKTTRRWLGVEEADEKTG